MPKKNFLQLKYVSVNTSFAKFNKKIYRRKVAIALFESGNFANFSHKLSSFSFCLWIVFGKIDNFFSKK